MIKANEFRIGNFGKTDTEETGTVVAIYHKCVIFKTDKRGWVESYFPKPIPLTPEVLEKCGFEKDRNGFALADKMSLSFSVTKEFGYLACWQDKVLHLRYDVKYLHQLQNLNFALTGEELTYNP